MPPLHRHLTLFATQFAMTSRGTTSCARTRCRTRAICVTLTPQASNGSVAVSLTADMARGAPARSAVVGACAAAAGCCTDAGRHRAVPHVHCAHGEGAGRSHHQSRGDRTTRPAAAHGCRPRQDALQTASTWGPQCMVGWRSTAISPESVRLAASTVHAAAIRPSCAASARTPSVAARSFSSSSASLIGSSGPPR